MDDQDQPYFNLNQSQNLVINSQRPMTTAGAGASAYGSSMGFVNNSQAVIRPASQNTLLSSAMNNKQTSQ